MEQYNDPIKPYVYIRLTEKRSIRLLTILPSVAASAPIRCSLTTTHLDRKPVYDAVSYTWKDDDGDSDTSQCVICDGCAINVTRNCVEVLRRLRQSSELRVVWIDAVCIDQKCINEVNQQVQIMGDIYRTTQATWVWLGPGTADSDNALKILDEYAALDKCSSELETALSKVYSISRKCTDMSTDSTFTQRSEASVQTAQDSKQSFSSLKVQTLLENILGHRLHSKTCLFDGKCRDKLSELNRLLEGQQQAQRPPSLWSAVRALFQRPWWRRLWVLQEVALAPKVFMICGDYQTDYARLTSHLPPSVLREVNQTSRMNAHQYFRKLIQGEPPYLGMCPMPDPYDIFATARSNLASNPRDKVYGIIGLLEHLDRGKLPLPRPDYSRSVAEVYLDMTSRLIAYSSSLRMLENCTGQESDHKLPSWIPDYSIHNPWEWRYGCFESVLWIPDRLEYIFKGELRTFGSSRPTVRPGSAVLQVHARIFGIVEQVAHPLKYLSWAHLAQTHAVAFRESFKDTFCGLLSIDLYFLKHPGQKAPDAYLYDYEQDFEIWNSRLSETEGSSDVQNTDPKSEIIQRFQKQIEYDTRGRTAFLTEDCHVGMAPLSIRPGDVLVNIVDQSKPFVLRREGKQFKMVGACYVRGLMYSESFLLGDADFEWIEII